MIRPAPLDLTDKAHAALGGQAPTPPSPTGFVCHPGHPITVTPGAFGRGYAECACGWHQTCASKFTATRAALNHHHQVGGCNCPPVVTAHDIHPGRRP